MQSKSYTDVSKANARFEQIRARVLSRIPYMLELGILEVIEATKPIVPFDPTDDGQPHLEDSGKGEIMHISMFSSRAKVTFSNIIEHTTKKGKTWVFDYAIIQHERCDFNHPVKGECQYLIKGEVVARPGWELIIAREMNSV